MNVNTQEASSLLGHLIRYAIERHHLQQTLQQLREKAQHNRERQEIERLSGSADTTVTGSIHSGDSLPASATDRFNQISARYCALPDVELQEYAHTDHYTCSDELRRFGVELPLLRASPRDVVEIHASELKANTLSGPWRRAQAYRHRTHGQSRRLLPQLLHGVCDPGARE